MRINYRNFPAIQVVDPDRCAEYIRTDVEHFFCAFNAQNRLTPAEAYNLEGRTYMQIYNGFYATDINLYYVSKTFLEALWKSAGTLYKMLASKEECDKVQEDCAFIYDNILWIVKHEPNGLIRMLRIAKEGALFTSFYYRLEENGFFSTTESTTDAAGATSMLSFYYLLMMVKKYGSVEMETLPKRKKVRSEILKEKAFNETGIDVQVLDSRWFTTICRDEGFLVSGHFRLQPCKDEHGEWTRKLIYINPYAKHGYHRMAPIVNLTPEEQ